MKKRNSIIVSLLFLIVFTGVFFGKLFLDNRPSSFLEIEDIMIEKKVFRVGDQYRFSTNFSVMICEPPTSSGKIDGPVYQISRGSLVEIIGFKGTYLIFLKDMKGQEKILRFPLGLFPEVVEKVTI